VSARERFNGLTIRFEKEKKEKKEAQRKEGKNRNLLPVLIRHRQHEEFCVLLDCDGSVCAVVAIMSVRGRARQTQKQHATDRQTARDAT